MSFELINLTLSMVLREIEEVLEEYPEHPYQTAFSIHEFRQKLLAHVLSQIPNCYTIAEEQAPVRKPGHSNFSPFPLAERLHLEMVIRGGILHILRENADRLSDIFLQTNRSEPVASSALQIIPDEQTLNPALGRSSKTSGYTRQGEV